MTKVLLIIVGCFLIAQSAWCQCTDYDAVQNFSYQVIRTGDNQIYSYAEGYVTDNEDLWSISVSATVTQNGGYLHSDEDDEESPSAALVGWYDTLQTVGPGTFAIPDSDFDFTDLSVESCELDYTNPSGTESLSVSQPSISGVGAFWWLGGVASDGYPGPVYYAQAAWTANGNGATSTPSWIVQTVADGGSVSLSCTPCSVTEATSTAASNGCVYDVTVYASFGGFYSTALQVAIIKPASFTNQSGSPANNNYTAYGYKSIYTWALYDSCGNLDSGLDGNEQIGSVSASYVGNNWGTPVAASAYSAGYLWTDTIGCSQALNCTTPPAENPQSPLTSVEVFHDTPWKAFIGTQTTGSGANVHSDDQQFFQDHGVHQ